MADEDLDLSLFAAAKAGNVADLKQLLAEGADAAYQDDADGSSVLMHAASSGSLEAIDLLLEAGAVRFRYM